MTLVLIHLRGGADGLNMVVPYNEPSYYRLRPELSLQKERLILLDGSYGLHPALAPLYPLYEQKLLAVVEAVGWRGSSHSHFEAWQQIEAGGSEGHDGWLSRYLALEDAAGSLQAVEFSQNPTGILRGAKNAVTLERLDALGLEMSANARKRLFKLYERSKLRKEADDAMKLVALTQHSAALPTGYPDTDFGRDLHAIERLLPIGLRAAVVHLHGWDTHFAQGGVDGEMARLMSELAQGLRTFISRLGERRVTVIVMTEFGRRVAENSTSGTDHGQGSVMLFLGAGVRGGRVYGDWPGLERLTGPGDMRITTDYRDALGAMVAARYGEGAVSRVFKGYKREKDLGIFEVS